jgi:hypothetical protein
MTTKQNKLSYMEVRAKGQNPFNNFEGLFFAFSNEQLAKGMKKLGLTMNDTDKIVSIGHGGFLLKSRREAFKEMMDNGDKIMDEWLKDDDNLLQAFVYELDNHEYCYTYDLEPAVEALGFTMEEVYADKRMAEILLKASEICKIKS